MAVIYELESTHANLDTSPPTHKHTQARTHFGFYILECLHVISEPVCVCLCACDERRTGQYDEFKPICSTPENTHTPAV